MLKNLPLFQFVCILFLLNISIFAQQDGIRFYKDCLTSAEKKQLFTWPPDSLSNKSLMEMLLISEGISDRKSIASFQRRFEHLLVKLNKKVKPNHSAKKKSKTIFKFLHKETFKKYRLTAKFGETFVAGEYNCLTATAFFYLLAAHYDVPLDIYLTPTHVFAALPDEKKTITIELTSPKKGFDYKDDAEEHIKYLLEYKLISALELEEKGAARIYSEYIEERRKIPPALLVPTMYNNIFAFGLEENRLSEAFCALRKAILLDSASAKYPFAYFNTLLGLIQTNLSNPSKHWEELVIATAFFSKNDEYGPQLWELAYTILGQQIELYKNYGKAAKMFRQLEAMMPEEKDSVATEKVAEMEKFVKVADINRLSRRGDYRNAYDKILPLYRKYPTDNRLEDGLLDIGVRYAAQLGDRGHIDSAAVIMDTLLNRFKNFPSVKEAYIGIIMRRISGDLMSGENFDFVEKWLLRGNEIDPHNQTIIQMLPRVYHSWGMEKVRTNRLWEARRIVEKGLKFARGDRQLNADLDQILDAIAFEEIQKKKTTNPKKK